MHGQRVVILGASGEGSMGVVLGERLIEKGAQVVLAARRRDALKSVATRIGALFFVCDITDESQVSALADFAVEKLGKVDTAVNAAGQAFVGDIATTDEAALRGAIDVHLIGTFFFLKHMQRAIGNDGSMTCISSITASRVIHNHAAYVCAKAGADHLVRVAAMEFGERNIRVNSVSPGFTGDTPMSRDFLKLDGLQETFEKQIPLGRLNTARDVAQTICWLSDPETFVTGENIQVNGGNALTRMPSKKDFVALMNKSKLI